MCVRCKVKNLRNGVNLLVLDLLARDHHEALGPYLYHREAPFTSGLIGSRPGPNQGTLCGSVRYTVLLGSWITVQAGMCVSVTTWGHV